MTPGTVRCAELVLRAAGWQGGPSRRDPERRRSPSVLTVAMGEPAGRWVAPSDNRIDAVGW